MKKLSMKMVNIIQVNVKMVQHMEKENYIIRMEILNMKVILLMVKKKEMENVFLKMVNIIQVNGKMV